MSSAVSYTHLIYVDPVADEAYPSTWRTTLGWAARHPAGTLGGARVTSTRVVYGAVSYTHLDVYKRQVSHPAGRVSLPAGRVSLLRKREPAFLAIGFARTIPIHQRGRPRDRWKGPTSCHFLPSQPHDTLTRATKAVSYTHLDVYKRQG